jgi:hypothetical protein
VKTRPIGGGSDSTYISRVYQPHEHVHHQPRCHSFSLESTELNIPKL